MLGLLVIVGLPLDEAVSDGPDEDGPDEDGDDGGEEEPDEVGPDDVCRDEVGPDGALDVWLEVELAETMAGPLLLAEVVLLLPPEVDDIVLLGC